jgi:hypothetical protein
MLATAWTSRAMPLAAPTMAWLRRSRLVAAAAQEAAPPTRVRTVAPARVAVAVGFVVVVSTPWQEPVVDRRPPVPSGHELVLRAGHPHETLHLRRGAGGALRGERILLGCVQMNEDRKVGPLEAVDARRPFRQRRHPHRRSVVKQTVVMRARDEVGVPGPAPSVEVARSVSLNSVLT